MHKKVTCSYRKVAKQKVIDWLMSDRSLTPAQIPFNLQPMIIQHTLSLTLTHPLTLQNNKKYYNNWSSLQALIGGGDFTLLSELPKPGRPKRSE